MSHAVTERFQMQFSLLEVQLGLALIQIGFTLHELGTLVFCVVSVR